MNRLWRRFRIWLALLLVRNTGCVLLRRQELEILRGEAAYLLNYVATSGALLDPRRVKAHRNISGAAARMEEAAAQVVVGV